MFLSKLKYFLGIVMLPNAIYSQINRLVPGNKCKNCNGLFRTLHFI